MAPAVLGISFDGLAISGIVSELVNAVELHRRRGRGVAVDLGYDIAFRRPSGEQFLPPWLDLVRAAGESLPKDYTPALVNEVFDRVVNGTSVAAMGVYEDICNDLASRLVTTFDREGIRFLHVENGTLPDNPLFTEALYIAIREYGARQNFGKFVLWRDFDLMWSAEPHLYGPFPYPGVHKPEVSPYIHYAVVTDWMRKRMETWARGPQYHVIPDRFFTLNSTVHKRRSPRAAYGIPEDAFLIARCTRVIPQKSVERDLRLLDILQQQLRSEADPRRVFLFVCGRIDEEPDEFHHLRAVESSLSIAGQVIWADGMLPFTADPNVQREHFSVRDLLAESDLSSFLTTYDYEGFGNPPGEAMAAGVPFIATTYELYEEVYGSKGAVAPLLPIDRRSSPSDPIPEFFVAWVLRALKDEQYRREIVTRNLDVCRRFFSLDALERQLSEIFAGAW